MIDDIPIYVINLDRAPERLEHAAAELAAQSLSFRRVPAVDGRALSEADIAKLHDAARTRRTYHVPMQATELACFLSHRVVWETFLKESQAPGAVILEDDFSLRGDLASVVRALRDLPAGMWEYVKLWGQDRRIVRNLAPLGEGFRLVQEAFISRRTVGQVVSRGAAEKLLARSLPIHRPIDTQLQYPWETGVRIHAVQPSVMIDVGETVLGQSSTRAAAKGFGGSKLKREVRRAALRIDRTMRALGYFVGNQA